MNNITLAEMEELVSYVDDDRELMELSGEYGRVKQLKKVSELRQRKDFDKGVIIGYDL